MNRRVSSFALVALSISACQDPTATTSVAPPSLEGWAALAAPDSGSYIILLAPSIVNVDNRTAEIARAHGGSVSHVYHSAVRGFAGHFSAGQAAAIARRPDVALVEADRPMRIVTTQTDPSWGLDRVDQRALPLSSTYVYAATGAGVNVYIIDTGIRTTHSEFGGRATGDFTAIGDANGASDWHGHGTHVAATAGARRTASPSRRCSMRCASWTAPGTA